MQSGSVFFNLARFDVQCRQSIARKGPWVSNAFSIKQSVHSDDLSPSGPKKANVDLFLLKIVYKFALTLQLTSRYARTCHASK